MTDLLQPGPVGGAPSLTPFFSAVAGETLERFEFLASPYFVVIEPMQRKLAPCLAEFLPEELDMALRLDARSELGSGKRPP